MPTRPDSRNEFLAGTLDLLILQTLTLGQMHGYAVARHIERTSEDALRVEQGSLYPALERLQSKCWVTSSWSKSPTGRRARYYTITASGRKRLGQKISAFDGLSLAISRVLGRS
jgi:transcriptional regulator